MQRTEWGAMTNVIELDAHRPKWLTGRLRCGSCDTVAVSVFHEDRRSELECPLCGLMDAYIDDAPEAFTLLDDAALSRLLETAEVMEP